VLIYLEETHKMSVISDNPKNLWFYFWEWGRFFGWWWK